jgi:hypothetical protein
MSNIPDWMGTTWVVVSGLAFLFSLLLNLALVYVVLAKVVPLLTQLQHQVKTVGDKAGSITTTAKATVDNIHSKTTQILGGAEEASAEVVRKVSAASAALTAVFVVARLVGAIRGMQAQNQPIKVQTVKVKK